MYLVFFSIKLSSLSVNIKCLTVLFCVKYGFMSFSNYCILIYLCCTMLYLTQNWVCIPQADHRWYVFVIQLVASASSEVFWSSNPQLQICLTKPEMYKYQATICFFSGIQVQTSHESLLLCLLPLQSELPKVNGLISCSRLISRSLLVQVQLTIITILYCSNLSIELLRTEHYSRKKPKKPPRGEQWERGNWKTSFRGWLSTFYFIHCSGW